jgi:hypothetical protein
VNIGARLPLLYERAGLRVTDITSTTKVGRPGSPEWKWLTTYFLGVLRRYADFRPFTPRQATSLRRHWLACAKRRTSLIISPTVIDVVGVKPR